MNVLGPYLLAVTALFVFAALVGEGAHWVDRIRFGWAAEMTRLTVPLPPPRVSLSDGIEVVAIGHRHPAAPTEPLPADEDEPACATPCRGRHCAEHSDRPGTVAQQRPAEVAEQRAAHLAWNTPTAEWDVTGLLGLAVPDCVPAELHLTVRQPSYVESAT